jgi:Fic family protein
MLSPRKVSEFTAGIWLKQKGYRSLLPEKINRQWLVDQPEIEALTAQAHQKLGELNAFSELVPDVDFFIKMHIAKEATYSCRIEGTQTSMEEAFLRSEDIRPDERDDWQEVQNYISAMNFAVHRLDDLPFSNRLIREVHQQLMQGVRGASKQPGEFRRSQNWIGGATLMDAIFVPPPAQEVAELMSDLELFLHNEEIYISDLVRVAIAHYQFETIHPFLDGNGRVGRLFVTLYLVSKKVLLKPSLYLSAFFEAHRSLYYDNLSGVRNKNDLSQWLKFFMVGVIGTAASSISTFKNIAALKSELEINIAGWGRRQANARKLLHYLFSQPVVTAKTVEEALQVSAPTANNLVNDFSERGLLTEKTGYQRNRIFSFKAYLEIFSRE